MTKFHVRCNRTVRSDIPVEQVIAEPHSGVVNNRPATAPLAATHPVTISEAGGGSRWLLIGLALGYFMVLLDSTILNVALPAIATSLGGSVTGQQWTISAYLVTFGACLLSSGAVADRIGAKRTFLIGLAAFGAASLLCALAPNLLLLIIFRALQGAGAALIPSSTLSLIGAMFPDPAGRHRAVGGWALITGIGFAAGPLLGGLLLAVGSWHLVFLVNLPVALVALIWCRSLPASAPGKAALDGRSQLAAMVFFGLLINAVIQLGADPRRWWWFGPAVLALGLLVHSERRSSAPAIPLPVLRIGGVRQAVLVGFGIQVVMAGALFVLGLQLIDDRSLTPVLAGVALLPYLLGPMFGPFVARLVAARGPGLSLRCGLAATAIGLGSVGVTVIAQSPLWVTMIGLAVAGTGLPLTIVPMTSLVVGSAPAGTGGVASGLFNAARQIGGAVGVAGLGIFIRLGGPGVGAGWALVTVAAVAALLLVGTTRIRQPTR